MSNPIRSPVQPAASRAQPDASSQRFSSSRAFPFAHSSTNSMPGPTSFVKKVQKSSRATSSTRPRSRRL